MNCRNTHEISERVAAVYGERVWTLGIHGPKPAYVQLQRPGDARDKVEHLVARMIDDEGFDPRQITVLTADPSIRTQFDGMVVGGRPIDGPDGRGVTVETVEGFVGLESDVIVFVVDDVVTDRDRAIAYSAMSRARALLIVLGPKQTRAALNWD